MKKLWNEFKEFINRGNVMDLAVAVVMGAAFTAIINSVVGDFITPLLSLLTFGVDLSSLSLVIGQGEHAAEFTYGKLFQAVINFLAIAVVVFLMIKGVNVLARKTIVEIDSSANAPSTKTCPYCESTIPLAAVRCPNCTTVLDASKVPKDVR